MIGICLSYSLVYPEDAMIIQNNLEFQNPMPQVPQLPFNQPKQVTYPNQPEIQKEMQQLIPLENAIVPYQPLPQMSDTPDLDLMSFIAEVENDEIPDKDLVFVATQCEKSESFTTPTTITKTVVMKKTSS